MTIYIPYILLPIIGIVAHGSRHPTPASDISPSSDRMCQNSLALCEEAYREYPEIDPAPEGFEVSIWQKKTGGAAETTLTAFLWQTVLRDLTVVGTAQSDKDLSEEENIPGLVFPLSPTVRPVIVILMQSSPHHTT